MKPGFSIIGCGRVGCALARHLADAGYPPGGFYSRSIASARRAAMLAGAGKKAFDHEKEAVADAGIIFITTPDSVIGDAAENLAKQGGIQKGTVILHCSGALPSTELDCLKSLGAVTGAMHPLQSFASSNMDGNPFSGIMMAVEGTAGGVETAKTIVKDLGAVPFEIRTDGKILYHSAAVLASNYLVALMDAAISLMTQAGVEQTQAFSILKPLVFGTLANIEDSGTIGALTGPVARGDVKTVERHVAQLREKALDILSLYGELGRHT
ncbi:MAG: DUF2520 domain-containing protein, partial [Deltaproteobacteria bacterium]|nr:DUF2520 domain-containing protein [Deltaproteobacteria bacterium]